MDSPEEGLSVHPMRLKVLYTFDKEHKHNHLARCPSMLSIRTAYVDDANQIGIIDLKTCVQTIVTASPELVAKLDEDFTIYAYDYSEPDSPLVGQGMLSAALSSQSGEQEDGTNMVTGRVTRNVLGLFSKNAQETLEVKLRLVPVPGSTQSDYLNSLQRYQQISGSTGQGFDMQSWTNFIQSNHAFGSKTAPTPPMDLAGSPVDRSGLETMQRMLVGAGSPRDNTEMTTADFSLQARPQGSRPGSRAGTPVAGNNVNQSLRRTGSHISRPSSRTSVRDTSLQTTATASHRRRESFNSGYFSGDEGFEEGPAKKRAKIVQADWSDKPNLNIERQPDSLRVAASTAASVRLHRPVPVNPILQLQQGNNEEPVRPPTPIARQSRGAAPKVRMGSSLRAGSFVLGSSPPPMHTNHTFPDMTSPEETRVQSIASTPNIPSSPPIMQNGISAPSSPVLPPMPKDHDSGFMSGGGFDIDGYFTDNPLLNFEDDFTPAAFPGHEFNLENPSNEALISNASSHSSNPTSVGNSQSPPVLSLSTMTTQVQPLAAAQKKQHARAASSGPASRNAMHSPKLAAAPYPRARQIEQERNQQGQILPQVPASDPAGPSLHRSQTWAGDLLSDVPMSDMTEPMNANNRRSRPKRFGKEQTANRLAAAISGGEMPPFCDNCGAIETPAWRKAWARIFHDGWDKFETGLEKDSFLAKEVIDKDADGKVKKFKAFKIMKSPNDDDREFLSVNLCNPCGLWLHKQKCMRPESRWNKNAKDPKEKKKRPSRPRSQRKAAQKKRGDDPTKSDAPASSPEGSDGVAASEQDIEEDNEGEYSRQLSGDDDNEPELPPMPSSYRSNSAEPSSKPQLKRTHNVDTIVRRVQSSPVRHEVEGQDLTPKPLRRILFSPDHSRSKALAEVSGNAIRRSPRLNKAVDILSEAKTPSHDKENDGQSNGDGLDELFNDQDDDQPHPQTPTPTRRSDRVFFRTPNSKTPSKTHDKTPVMLSPAAQRLLSILKTPKTLASHQPIAAALLGEQATGTQMTPFTLQIHQILSDAGNHNSPTRSQRSSASKSRSHRNAVTDSRGSRRSDQGNNNIFDFPDLPPLNNTSPNSTNGLVPLVDFSEFTNTHHSNGQNALGINDLMLMDDAELQELLSTDIVMPSSPPANLNTHDGEAAQLFNWFDHDHGSGSTGLWDEMGGNHHQNAEDEQDVEGGRRVSPRRSKGKKV